MPTAVPDIILLNNVATAVAGPGIGFGEGMRYVNSGNKHQVPVKFLVNVRFTDTATGGTATVKIQESNDDVTYTDLNASAFVLAITAAPYNVAKRLGFSTKKRFIRANVTALAGTTAPVISVYTTLGSWGA